MTSSIGAAPGTRLLTMERDPLWRRALSLVLWGCHRGAVDRRLTRWVFLRLLAVVYLVALVSYWVQVDGLIGSEGILPLGDHLAWAEQQFGEEARGRLPTLFWWGHSDGALHATLGAGVVLALLLLVGVAPGLMLVALWGIYLSLVVAGQVFLGFQWDALLLETTLLSLFYAPWRLRPRWPGGERPVPRGGPWLIRFLLFKLMFLSGIVKLICLDPTWWELTALPRIGETIARRVARHRESAAAASSDGRADRVFRTPSELANVRGIGPATVRRIAPHLVFEVQPPRASAAR